MLRSTLLLTIAATLSPQSMAKALNTVASFSVLADIVREVGGKHVRVTSLVSPKGDLHAFEPKPKDSVIINKADLIVLNGLGLEEQISRLISSSGYLGEMVTASEGVNVRLVFDDGKILADPHAWNTMGNGIVYARNIMKALIKADPEHKNDFIKLGKAYIDKLIKLDLWAKKKFSSIPEEKKKVLVTHDSFGYFGAEYHISFLSPAGFSSKVEISAQDMAVLIEELRREHITTYFTESRTDIRMVRQIALAVGAKRGGVLFPETLLIQSRLINYTEAFQHNVEVIMRGTQ